MKYLEYQENLKRGSEGFPVSYYHLSPLHPRYHMPPHWHNEYEIIRVLSGELNVNINNRPLVLKKNDTAIINSGFLHSAEPKNGGCYECIVFDMEYFLKQRSSAPELPNELLNRQKLIYDFSLQMILNFRMHSKKSPMRWFAAQKVIL